MKSIYLIIFALFCMLTAHTIHYESDGSTDCIKHLLFSIGLISSIVSFIFMILGI